CLAISCLLTLFGLPVQGSSVAKGSAGSVAVASGSWFNASSAATKNGACAATVDPGSLSLSKYGFAIPTDATITCGGVPVWTTANTSTTTVGLKLYGRGATATLRSVAVAAATGCGAISQSSGGDGDLWGLTLTPADVNSTTAGGFGVVVSG